MYSFASMTYSRVSFCPIILLAHELLACSRSSDSGMCHSPLSERLEQGLINSCFLLPPAQILAETPPLSIHDSPFPADEQDTVGTFPAPPNRTGKVFLSPTPLPPVPRLPNHRSSVTKPIGD